MANSFELTGTLKVLEDTQTFASGFAKREFVIEVPDGKYPQLIKFEVLKEKISLLDSVSIEDDLKVTFDVRGREYNGKYFVNLNAWKVESSGGGQGGGQGGSSAAGAPADPPPSSFDNSFDNEAEPSDDDIPF